MYKEYDLLSPEPNKPIVEEETKEKKDKPEKAEKKKVKKNNKEPGKKPGGKGWLTGIGIGLAMAGCTALGAAVPLLLERTTASVVREEEANIDVGGRITDRVEDVNDSVRENADLLKETKELAENSNAKYEDMKNTLEGIEEELSNYEETLAMQETEDTGLKEEYTGGQTSADIACGDEKLVRTSIDEILKDVEALKTKTENSQSETMDLLKKIEKENNENEEETQDILDTYYIALEKKNKELSASVSSLDTKITDTIGNLEKKEGTYFENTVKLLGKAQTELNDTINKDLDLVETYISVQTTDLKSTINSDYQDTDKSLNDSRKEILTSISDICTELKNYCKELETSVMEKTEKNGEQLTEANTLLQTNAEEVKKMEDSLSTLDSDLKSLSDGLSTDEVLDKEHSALRQTMRESGIEIKDDAAIEDYCSAIKGLSDELKEAQAKIKEMETEKEAEEKEAEAKEAEEEESKQNESESGGQVSGNEESKEGKSEGGENASASNSGESTPASSGGEG